MINVGIKAIAYFYTFVLGFGIGCITLMISMNADKSKESKEKRAMQKRIDELTRAMQSVRRSTFPQDAHTKK